MLGLKSRRQNRIVAHLQPESIPGDHSVGQKAQPNHLSLPLAQTVSAQFAWAAGSAALAACNTLIGLLTHGDPRVESIKFAVGAPLLAREGFASLDALPQQSDVDWLEAFLESPTDVFVHAAIALLLVAERPGTATSTATCSPKPKNDQASSFAFEVPTRQGKRTWHFGWEQRRFKLVDSALVSTRRNEEFFRQVGAPRGAGKQWTPRLR